MAPAAVGASRSLGLNVRLNEFFLPVKAAVWCAVPEAPDMVPVAAASDAVFIAPEVGDEVRCKLGGSRDCRSICEPLFLCELLYSIVF